MVKINLVAVGKVKEKYFQDAFNEYSKRLSRFCEFKLIEVKEENFDKVDQGLIDIIKDREAKRILPHLTGCVLAFAIEGENFDSESFSKTLKKLSDLKGSITLVIGGSYGLAKEIKDKSDKLISFSNMTFPHTLFRVIAVEQLYRAFCIINGVSYHK